MRLIVCFGGTGKGFYSAKPKEMSRQLGAAGVGFRSVKPVPGSETLVYLKWVLKDEALMKRWGAKLRGRQIVVDLAMDASSPCSCGIS